MSHALVGVLTCAHIHSIELDRGATSMSGGIPWLTLPAATSARRSKGASLVLAAFFLVTLWTWVLLLGMSGLIVLFWFVAGGEALRYLVLFIGVMSCLYVLWDVIDDTIARKVNSSDASAFADICGCFPSRVWGVIWLFIAFAFFARDNHRSRCESASQQKEDAKHFLPVPGSNSAPPLQLSFSWVLVSSMVSVALVALT
ncbi:peptidase M50B-like-domain-containing protein [Gloeopeniophorella convolvens]|nr:peptidase M50B-like-domain-containing protein [Gloeopeniophorella convolvens]